MASPVRRWQLKSRTSSCRDPHLIYQCWCGRGLTATSKGPPGRKSTWPSPLLGPAAEAEEAGRVSSWKAGAGIPILANCLVGRLPKLRCEKRRRRKEVTHVPADLTVSPPAPPAPSLRPGRNIRVLSTVYPKHSCISLPGLRYTRNIKCSRNLWRNVYIYFYSLCVISTC